MSENNTPGYCECGHDKFEHIAGHKECTVPGCKCQAFHWVNLDIAKKRTCIMCGRDYQCSHPTEGESGICNICRKQIEDNYQGDLINFLFGYRDGLIPKLKAKQLAMDIKASGLDIRALWEFWQQNHK